MQGTLIAKTPAMHWTLITLIGRVKPRLYRAHKSENRIPERKVKPTLIIIDETLLIKIVSSGPVICDVVNEYNPSYLRRKPPIYIYIYIYIYTENDYIILIYLSFKRPLFAFCNLHFYT